MFKVQATFRNKQYGFLSNFQNFDTPMKKVIEIEGIKHNIYFRSSEAFYMAMKTTDPTIRLEIANAKNGAEAKQLGKTVILREDWEDIKEYVMLYALRYKFSLANPSLREKLIATKDSYLQEGNWWNDKYWGVCLKTGEGKNRLGYLLMQVRREIQEERC